MRGVVVAPQPRAAEAGARVLEQGGNAFDAAIATAFVQMVVDPFMCGIGGFGTAHLCHVQRGEHRVESYAPDFSRPQLVRILAPGRFDGGSDPRGDGGGVVSARG